MVPRVLAAAHDSSSHWGFDKTSALVKHCFHHPGLSAIVRDDVRTCPDCQRIKASRLPRLGNMSSHGMARKTIHTVSMDVILGLPTSSVGRFNACLVIVDQFSKAIL